MPHTAIEAMDPQAHARKPNRRMRQHAMGALGSDPVSLAKRKPLATPSNGVLLAIMAAFGLYATGHLKGLDHFFDRVQNFGRAHNDVVVRGILHYLPATLFLTAAVVITMLGLNALRIRSLRARNGSVDEKTLKAAMANILRASAKRTTLETMETLAAETALPKAVAKAATRNTPLVHSRDGIEVARLRRDAQAAANARAAAAGYTVAATQAPVMRRPLSDSMPTLPFNARVRRRNPHGALPPQLAAALKTAAATPARPR